MKNEKKTLFLLIFLCFACKQNQSVNKNIPKIKSEKILQINDSILNSRDYIGFESYEEKLYFYDNRNRLKKLIIDSSNIYEYEYTEFDSIKIVKNKNDKKTIISYLYYNKSNYPIKRIDSMDGKNVMTINKKYNSNNKLIKMESYFPESNYKEIILKNYDSNGKLKNEEIQRGSEPTKNNIYEYEKNLIIVKEDFVDNSNYTEVKKYYNSEKTLIKNIVEPIGATRYMILIQEFDKFGNLKKHLQLDENNDTIGIWSYKYKYDSNKNWIIKTSIHNDSISGSIKREIKYEE